MVRFSLSAKGLAFPKGNDAKNCTTKEEFGIQLMATEHLISQIVRELSVTLIVEVKTLSDS